MSLRLGVKTGTVTLGGSHEETGLVYGHQNTPQAEWSAFDLLPRPPAWMNEAACVHAPTVTFIGGARGARYSEAVAVCGSCVVRAECLDYALRLEIADGVWGGKRPAELRAMQRTPAEGVGDIQEDVPAKPGLQEVA